MSEFKTVNRVAITMIPKETFINFLNKVFPANTTTLESAYSEGFQVYLVPNFSDEQKANAYLKRIAPMVLEKEFESWKIPKESWPEKLTIDVLLDFFEYDASVGLFDTITATKPAG